MLLLLWELILLNLSFYLLSSYWYFRMIWGLYMLCYRDILLLFFCGRIMMIMMLWGFSLIVVNSYIVLRHTHLLLFLFIALIYLTVDILSNELQLELFTPLLSFRLNYLNIHFSLLSRNLSQYIYLLLLWNIYIHI